MDMEYITFFSACYSIIRQLRSQQGTKEGIHTQLTFNDHIMRQDIILTLQRNSDIMSRGTAKRCKRLTVSLY